MIQWEYKVETLRSQTIDDLNKLGLEGWELAAVVFRFTSPTGGNYYDYFDYYFKRQITDNK